MSNTSRMNCETSPPIAPAAMHSAAKVTNFERLYLCLQPVYAPLYREVRSRLREIVAASGEQPVILDVGGRKSHYTIGIPAQVVISDLPRKTALQERLNLGVNGTTISATYARRSNVQEIVYDDMTQSALPSESYECATAVEVLEHVELDEQFVKGVHRVLKPGGVFLMTTPNGEFVKNVNPDHKRHYTRDGLEALLRRTFPEVSVDYAIQGGRFHRWSLDSWSCRRPWTTLRSMIGSMVTWRLSRRAGVRQRGTDTCHLIAVAKK